MNRLFKSPRPVFQENATLHFANPWFNMSGHMDITLNGQTKNIQNNSSLQALVEQYTPKPTHIVAELDGAIITRDAWSRTMLKAGSKVELVTFVGGG